MISKEMEKALNHQIKLEADASFLYLSMASWLEQKGMSGSCEFFYAQSEEERMHMMKIYRYLNEVGGRSIAPKVELCRDNFDSVKEIFELSLENEIVVTKAIHNLVNMSEKSGDYSTHNFLQWYVEEQREEVVTMRNILEKISLIGDGPGSLYYIDKELEKIMKSAGGA